MAEDSHVEFIDSKEGNQFTVRISRPLTATEAGSNTDLAVSSGKKAVSSDEKAVTNGGFIYKLNMRLYVHIKELSEPVFLQQTRSIDSQRFLFTCWSWFRGNHHIGHSRL